MDEDRGGTVSEQVCEWALASRVGSVEMPDANQTLGLGIRAGGEASSFPNPHRVSPDLGGRKEADPHPHAVATSHFKPYQRRASSAKHLTLGRSHSETVLVRNSSSSDLSGRAASPVEMGSGPAAGRPRFSSDPSCWMQAMHQRQMSFHQALPMAVEGFEELGEPSPELRMSQASSSDTPKPDANLVSSNLSPSSSRTKICRDSVMDFFSSTLGIEGSPLLAPKRPSTEFAIETAMTTECDDSEWTIGPGTVSPPHTGQW